MYLNESAEVYLIMLLNQTESANVTFFFLDCIVFEESMRLRNVILQSSRCQVNCVKL
jgi:hypothetical protein